MTEFNTLWFYLVQGTQANNIPKLFELTVRRGA